MPEYDIGFAEKLATVANMVATENLSTLDAQRTVLYLSLLSAEISLKAMLERAGMPVDDIYARSNRLSELLFDVGRCEIKVKIAPNCLAYTSAIRLRACELNYGDATITVGSIIDSVGERKVSCYPNQIRYGDVLKHFPPGVVAQMSEMIVAFARRHWNSIRII